MVETQFNLVQLSAEINDPGQHIINRVLVDINQGGNGLTYSGQCNVRSVGQVRIARTSLFEPGLHTDVLTAFSSHQPASILPFQSIGPVPEELQLLVAGE